MYGFWGFDDEQLTRINESPHNIDDTILLLIDDFLSVWLGCRFISERVARYFLPRHFFNPSTLGRRRKTKIVSAEDNFWQVSEEMKKPLNLQKFFSWRDVDYRQLSD
jgi:hypothetical protein